MTTGWNLPAPPGFKGLDPYTPVNIYTRDLPHWRQPGATYFVTFRLGDSLPHEKVDYLRRVKADWMQRHPSPSREELEALFRQLRLWEEDWLDEGFGLCVLRTPEFRDTVSNAVHYFDGERFELGCCVVMPNHVHAIVRPYELDDGALSRILQSSKRQSARDIHRAMNETGSLWQEESYDRIVRDEEHLYRCIQYIGRNPDKARLKRADCALWLNPAWEAIGWSFEPAVERI